MGSTTPLTGRPCSIARIFPAIWAMDSSRSVRAEPCGVTVIFGWRQKAWPAGSGVVDPVRGY